ncbi:MAG: class I SAM-dependent methyltransferase, partial [Anaerolineae bacterium]
METKAKHRRLINNAFYDDLKEDWYETSSHPIAFLRKENELRNPWIQKTIRRHSQDTGLSVSKILDMGCGAGFLANDLALQGYRVYGVDLSASSLEIGRQKDATKSV